MVTKFGRVVTYGWRVLANYLRYFLMMWSRVKRKALQLHFHNTDSLQIWESIKLRLEGPTRQVT